MLGGANVRIFVHIFPAILVFAMADWCTWPSDTAGFLTHCMERTGENVGNCKCPYKTLSFSYHLLHGIKRALWYHEDGHNVSGSQ